MRPLEEGKKEIVRQWLAKAEQDMRAGEALLAAYPPFLYPACFHAQQAAEKYLKAASHLAPDRTPEDTCH